MSSSLTIITNSPEETQQVGRIIGAAAQAGDVYLLTGPLGAGKTCLTQGIAWGMGVTGHPRSPTFVLMNRYQGRLTLHHMDLYRIGSPLEAWDLGLDEYLGGNGVCVIEWADQAEELFPEDSLWIGLDYAETGELAQLPEMGPAAVNSPEGQQDSRTITIKQASSERQALFQELAASFPAQFPTQKESH